MANSRRIGDVEPDFPQPSGDAIAIADRGVVRAARDPLDVIVFRLGVFATSHATLGES